MGGVKFLYALLLSLLLMLPAMGSATAAEPAEDAIVTGSVQPADQLSSSETVIQQFVGEDEVSAERRIETKRKHEILFLMGISLLVLILLTGIMGIAMAAFGKDVFVSHMILAGLSITLAIVHSVTAVVWFWPY